MLHKVEPVNQRDHDHPDTGCGAACLMMLLQHHRLPIKLPKYDQLCECLWLTVDPTIKGQDCGEGAYWSDVERALQGMSSPDGDKVQFSMIEQTNAKIALDQIRKALYVGPVMCAFKRFCAGEDHWVVITGDQEGELRYLDPWPRRQKERLSYTDFRKHWDDFGFFLTHPCNCPA